MKKEISYKKLWKLLIDKGINKKQLREMTEMSTTSLAKLTKGESVTTNLLLRICEKLDCDISDIMEVVPKKLIIKHW